MDSCFYYAFDDILPARAINACSRASDEYPLIVNCTGNIVTDMPLTTDNALGREDYYLIYMVSGTMDVTLGGRIFRTQIGDVIIFPPHCHYRYVYHGGERLSYLWVHFTGSYAKKFLAECIPGELPCIHATGGNTKTARDFNRMFDIFEAGSPLWRQELACSLEHLLLNISVALHDDIGEGGFEKSMNYIHSSYGKDISVEQLARMENLGYSSYIKLFKRRIGLPPTAYIIKLRMNAACDMLRNTDMSVKQIGAAVGYSDAHFFSRLFKKHTGMSPRQYREA